MDQEASTSWRSLNATERYFTLLEAWLVRVEGEIIGEYRDPLGSLFRCSTFMERLPDEGLKVAGNREAETSTIPYQVGTYNLALLDLCRAPAGHTAPVIASASPVATEREDVRIADNSDSLWPLKRRHS